jgi:DNA-binding YbaB/EbfC family protein
MFKEIGQMMSMMKNLPKLKANIEEFQSKLGSITADGVAGGDMVTVKANGRFEVVTISISEEAMKLNDKEMLEDLIRAAVNQAVAKARQAVSEETQKLGGDLGLPAGFGMPGM